MTRDDLWHLARDDAGFSAEQAVWLELSGTPAGGVDATWAVYAGPGAEIDQNVVNFDSNQRAWDSEYRGRLRVYTWSELSDAAALGLMRWALEYGRLELQQNSAMQL